MRVPLVVLVLMLALASSAFAQVDSAAVDSVSATLGGLPEIQIEDAEDLLSVASDSLAMVTLLGRELFPVQSVSVVGAERRAQDIAKTVREISESIRRRPEDIRVIRDDRVGATLVVCDTQFVVAAWDYEAAQLGTTADRLAEQRAEIIRLAMIRYREDFSARSLIRGGIIAGAALVGMLIAFLVLSRIRRRLENAMRHRLEGRQVFRVVEGESLISLGTGVDRLAWFLFVVWAWLFYLNFALSLFPWTHWFAAEVWELASGPAKNLGGQALDQIPSLFYLGFIAVVAVLVIRGVRYVFDEIGAKRIYIRGFYPDWARPTFNIVRLIVLGFAIVVAIPYIPGSGSGAFKGMSLFIGVLVSLGSGSAMANVISGVIMIYMRPFEIGDRVQIGDTLGDVVDRNLLTTRVRTLKNHRVTIPNTNVLGGQIVNFTSKGRTRELILNTSVTLGYDLDWRQVHELLISAAKATENILDDPEPFVLQQALQDFYVEYELNAYTGDPKLMAQTYSELHQNIQDRFKEANVEILSPHYRAHRNGELGADTPQVTPPGA